MTCAEGPSREVPNMFTDMPRETDVVQHQIKLRMIRQSDVSLTRKAKVTALPTVCLLGPAE